MENKNGKKQDNEVFKFFSKNWTLVEIFAVPAIIGYTTLLVFAKEYGKSLFFGFDPINIEVNFSKFFTGGSFILSYLLWNYLIWSLSSGQGSILKRIGKIIFTILLSGIYFAISSSFIFGFNILEDGFFVFVYRVLIYGFLLGLFTYSKKLGDCIYYLFSKKKSNSSEKSSLIYFLKKEFNLIIVVSIVIVIIPVFASLGYKEAREQSNFRTFNYQGDIFIILYENKTSYVASKPKVNNENLDFSTQIIISKENVLTNLINIGEVKKNISIEDK